MSELNIFLNIFSSNFKIFFQKCSLKNRNILILFIQIQCIVFEIGTAVDIDGFVNMGFFSGQNRPLRNSTQILKKKNTFS